MVAHLYKLECLTNLHVGSGEANYNIIDREVERDPITGYPIIHASGLKGALREYFTENKLLDDTTINRIFGRSSSTEEYSAGQYKFLDAHLLSRPMRVGGVTTMPCISVTADDVLRTFLTHTANFGITAYAGVKLPALNFGQNEFLAYTKGINERISVEDEATGKLDPAYVDAAKSIIGENFAVAKNISKYALPVVAHNKLNNGTSENLWYEEYVPHGSVFWFIVLTPNETMDLKLEERTMLQLGANASIGYGFVKFTKIA